MADPESRHPSDCTDCPVYHAAQLKKLGVDMANWDYVVALAGNPNTGKSTVFNNLTGLRQHTGNWPGKTVTRAEGGMSYAGDRFKLVDLPGTYSLLSASYDEEIARDFLLFGSPDVTVIVVDATRLERNLNLVLQILEITPRVVVCLNLVDEAERMGLVVDHRRLARDLGVPVVPAAARYGRGMEDLLQAIHETATGQTVGRPRRVAPPGSAFTTIVPTVEAGIRSVFPEVPNSRWVALRLLDGDASLMEAVRSGELGHLDAPDAGEDLSLDPAADRAEFPAGVALLEQVAAHRRDLTEQFHEQIVEAVFDRAARIADRAVTRPGETERFDWERAVDRVVTSRVWGFPIMALLFALTFWITIAGANYPSGWLSAGLIDNAYPWLKDVAADLGFPWWLSGVLIDGMYLATAWVVSVMLPPMAIFFPLFTLLEDLGYLPRVAFNLDRWFHRAGSDGKQALTMMMGFGCNAAGVIATRIIDSPRERLIAIVTNNFSLCNGRWPTQILLASLFLGVLAPASLSGLVSAGAVVLVAGLGVLLTFGVSWALSRTVLRGEASSVYLELPPYRPPRVLRTLYTSLIDRTLHVLWRAVVFALPAGAAIWMISNIAVGSQSLAAQLIDWLTPLGVFVGLNGVILLAYVVAIPANEIVIPTILMLTVLATGLSGVGEGAGVMFEPGESTTAAILQAGGWTTMTAVNVMLFSLLHNPCSTTIYTIFRETRNWRWTALASVLPLAVGFVVVFAVTQVWTMVTAAL
jgi:ferrous iron transport protein B